ncbi:MAG: type II toxin-antitoxin system VapC family toxin [Acidimicrobiia bacterium]
MRLLLDTHIWLWSLLEPERLAGPVSRRLEDPANELWLSPISVWEALLLAERGRVEFDREPSVWLDAELRKVPLRDAPLNREVALRSRTVDLPHQDPADRFLVATAAVYDLTLVTADERLLGASGYRVLANR